MASETTSMFARIAWRACLMFASFALAPAVTVLSCGVGNAAENEIVAPVQPVVTPAQSVPTPVQPIVTQLSEASEREKWRRTMQNTPKPKNGCFAATYPETEWREVRCKTPSNKLYPPKLVPSGMAPIATVGGGMNDFSAQVSGHLTEAEGSFDSVTGVTSECSVACPFDAATMSQVCPMNPTCSGRPANAYSLQLNTQPFMTSTCSSSPTAASCQGWQQFVYDGSGGGVIQYWLLHFGPAGTLCPSPRGNKCQPNKVSSDGWCPFSFTPGGEVFCVVNGRSAPSAPSAPITSLQQIAVTGVAAAGTFSDSFSVSIGGTISSASGDNHFPDLGSQWQIAEFNVFGDSDGDQAVFNTGSTLVVRTSVGSGMTDGPRCDAESFTGESNNLSLVGTTEVPPITALPSLVFTESNVPGSAPADCSKAVSVSTGRPIVRSISPADGQCGISTQVTIQGSNFTRVTDVVANSRSNLSPVSLQTVSVLPEQIIATIPAYLPGGVYEIVVNTALGGSTQVSGSSPTDVFSVVPTVSGITPTQGPVAGGTQVTVNGGCFDSRTRISFGGADASGSYPCGVGIGRSSQCVVYSPAAKLAGPVDVVANTNGAVSATGPADRFTYAGPQITSISPTSGPVTGGTEVQILGTGFPRYDLHSLQNTPMSFGSVGTVAQCDSTWCTVVSPPAANPGRVDVVATAFGAASGLSPGDVFTYSSTPVLTRFEFTRDYIGGLSAVVALDGNAPAGGATVALSSPNPNLVGMPPTATIPAGKATTIIPVTTNPSPTEQIVTSTAKYDATTLIGTVSIPASPPLTLSSDVTALGAGQSANVTVGLNSPAPSAGAAVALSSSDPAEFSVPSIVTIPAGAYSTVFSVSDLHSTSQGVTINAGYNGASASHSFAITAPARCTVMQCAKFYHWDSNLCRCAPGIPVAR